MKVEIEEISSSYFEHLYYSPGKSKNALVMNFGIQQEEKTVKEFFRVLSIIKNEDTEWIFSFWGKIFSPGNGSVLKFISQNEESLTYVVSGIDKTQDAFITPSFEVSLFCNLDSANKIFVSNVFHFSREFRFSGWLVPAKTKNLFLKNPKWAQGHFLFPSELNLAFCSDENRAAIRFFASEENILDEIFKKYLLKR